jgi:hypothetical protein
VVCRVFQKSIATKKPQQTSSSQPESPCDTTSMVNEFGDIELPNLNGITNSSSCGFTTFNTHELTNNNVNTNMNLTMNWPSSSEVQSLPWPSNLLNPNNISVNSLLLKALQLRNYQQQREVATTNHFVPYMPQQGVISHHLGNDLNNNSNDLSASSSKVLECMPQHQQEQPFNLDSIW